MNSQQQKKFGLWTLVFLVIANMIGAGGFSTSGFVMADLHSPSWVVAAWIVAGLIALAGAASYGKLIQYIPESGGEYTFLARAYHPSFGFVAGWVSMFAGFSGAISVVALLFEQYATPESWAEQLPKGTVAISVVVLAAILHGLKVKVGTRTQNLAVILMLFLLAAFLIVACFKLSPQSVEKNLEPLKRSDLAVAFCRQLMWIAFSYMGFNAAVYVADEVKDAKTLIPKSLMIGTAIVVFLYVALNFVFVFSADSSAVADSGPSVASMAAENLGGTWFRNLFTTIISIALFTSVTSMMMAAPRVYAKMADDGMLPSLFSFRNETPIYAIVLQVILSSIIILSSTLGELLGYLGVTLSICAAASVSSLFLSKYRQGRSLLSPYYFAPYFYVGATALAVVMTVMYNHLTGGPKAVYAALITFIVGSALYGIKILVAGPENKKHANGSKSE